MIVRLGSLLLLFFLTSYGAYACAWLDFKCHFGIGKAAIEKSGSVFEKTGTEIGNTIEKESIDVGKFFGKAASSAGVTPSKPLLPVRAYLRAKQIPPAGVGAYGLVVFQSRPTSANRSKLLMACKSFVAFFPRNETATVPVQDQMMTIWPSDDPDANEAKADDCNFAIDHYDLVASEAAIADAQRQSAKFEGEGPYLVGWSPSNSRGVPDKLVLVIDMSADNTQESIDHKFLFWKQKIVEDPSLWRSGFSAERIRVAIHDFADQYGQAMLDAIKLIGIKKLL